MAYAREIKEKEESRTTSYSYEMREKSCPKEYTEILDEQDIV